ncbi:MAG: beta-CASP ribonuclease aCPSF1 [Candidatus Micrarchaeota archaeon]|nr:beta-CASP ribonuclease aCPSF1 [Candidatus Micrarchaeota archaeon]
MELKEIEKKLHELVPSECKMTKVEAEGLDIVIYLKNIGAFYENDQLIRKIASTIRKRILVKSDPSSLMPPEEALKTIREIIPPEAGVAEDGIKFNPEFCEVNIEALKPGLVIGKGGVTLKAIIQKTHWAPVVLRTPTMPSSTIKGIRSSMLKEAAARKKFLNALGKKICTNSEGKSDWVKVTALGGFNEVGRSCALVQTPHSNVLIDCGINPETFEPTKAYPYLNAMNLELDQLDAVVLTHAHMDHCGFIPYLYAYGYEGPVYCTTPTRELAILLQMDFISIANKNSQYSPPYGIKDIQKELSHMVTVDYGEVIDITPEIKLTFYNAGHILGSAMVHLHIGEGLHNLVFSGDVKYGFTRLFDQANTVFPRVETLFLDSTYGGRNDIQPNRHEADKRLVELAVQVCQRGGKVLIPSFAVGRSQEIMLVFEEYASKNKDFNWPVYLDGMILEASAIHTAYPEYLRHSIQRRILSNDSPFESRIFEPVKKERHEIAEGEAAIIIAPSGMLSGGPSVEYLKLLAEDPKNALFFVGYQSALSLGRKIQRGQKEVAMIGDDGRTVSVKINMQVETVEGYSGHSDRNQLLSLLKNMRPKPEKVFTLHGDEKKCEDLSRSISHIMRIESRAPMNLDAIRLK